MLSVILARLLFALGSFALALAAIEGSALPALTHLLASGGLLIFALAHRQGARIIDLARQPGVWVTASLLAGSNLAMSNGLALLALPLAMLLIQSSTAWTVLLAPLYGERLLRLDLLALLCSVAGLLILLSGQLELGAWRGVFLLLLASLLTAVFMHRFALSARSGQLSSGYMGVVMGLGGLMLLPWQSLSGLPSSGLFCALAAAFCLGVANSLTHRGMREVSAARVQLMKPLGLIIGVSLGVMVLGDPLHWLMLPAAGLLLLSGWVVQLAHSRSLLSAES